MQTKLLLCALSVLATTTPIPHGFCTYKAKLAETEVVQARPMTFGRYLDTYEDGVENATAEAQIDDTGYVMVGKARIPCWLPTNVFKDCYTPVTPNRGLEGEVSIDDILATNDPQEQLQRCFAAGHNNIVVVIQDMSGHQYPVVATQLSKPKHLVFAGDVWYRMSQVVAVEYILNNTVSGAVSENTLATVLKKRQDEQTPPILKLPPEAVKADGNPDKVPSATPYFHNGAISPTPTRHATPMTYGVFVDVYKDGQRPPEYKDFVDTDGYVVYDKRTRNIEWMDTETFEREHTSAMAESCIVPERIVSQEHTAALTKLAYERLNSEFPNNYTTPPKSSLPVATRLKVLLEQGHNRIVVTNKQGNPFIATEHLGDACFSTSYGSCEYNTVVSIDHILPNAPNPLHTQIRNVLQSYPEKPVLCRFKTPESTDPASTYTVLCVSLCYTSKGHLAVCTQSNDHNIENFVGFGTADDVTIITK